MLPTTTHNRWRETLDGTDTQMATCAIDRWMAKMKEQKNIYNQTDLTKRGRQFGRHQEVLLVEYQKKRRRIHPRTRLKDGP